ncbi:MAG: FliM/FliN family flagellar motor switch protein [Vicinamibacterales bacterium]
MSSSPTSSSSSELHIGHESLPPTLAPMFDVRCLVEFILGTGTITIRDVLRLEPYSTIRLSQSAGSDLSVRVHSVTIATGEVVIADETTALRVNRVSPPAGVEVEP